MQTSPSLSHVVAIPAIGQLWLAQGGIYAGVCRGREGQPDHHLILADAKPTKRLTWKAAGTWASKVEADGHADFTLPDRHESAVLFGNVGDLFEKNWHWTATQSSSGYAWFQNFLIGSQLYYCKYNEFLARAVRRLPVSPSILYLEIAQTEQAAA